MTQTGNELDAARGYEEQIVRFLRDLIAIPAESGKEGDRCERVRREYEALGFDEVFFDGLGSVVARIGSGDFKILYDGHIDCVGGGEGEELFPGGKTQNSIVPGLPCGRPSN